MIIYKFSGCVGIGDNIRGLILIKQVQEIIPFELEIDLNGYPLGDFLLYEQKQFNPELEKSFPAFDNECHHNEIVQYIQQNPGKCIVIGTNCRPDYNISEPIKEYMKDFLKLKPQYEDLLQKKFNSLLPNYNLFHYRFGDVHLCEMDQTNEQYYQHFIHFKKENAVIISDSLLFKQRCSNVAKVFFNDPIHTRTNDNCKIGKKESLLFDTICDFYLIQKAKSINSLTCLPWISNFILWMSIIYNVPLYDLRR